MNIGESWGVNWHTTSTWFTSPISVVLRFHLAPSWGLHETNLWAYEAREGLWTLQIPYNFTLWRLLSLNLFY